MLQKNNREKILEIFFTDPLPKGSGYQLRELSKITNIAPPSVKNYLNELLKEKLIIVEKHRTLNYPTYFANQDNEYFKFLKKLNNIKNIKESGLLDTLKDTLMPDAIVLFGSSSKGEDVKESDIDLFLLCPEKKIDLTHYENKLNRKINLFFCKSFNKLSKEFKNNLINGILLQGYLKAFWHGRSDKDYPGQRKS